MWSIVTNQVAWSVCRSVCHIVNPPKTAETIEILFGLRTQMGPRNRVRWGPDPPWEGIIIRRKGRPVVKYRDTASRCAKMAEPIDLPFGLSIRLARRKNNFNRICQVVPMSPHGRPHWQQPANMIEPSVCSGDAALCQIIWKSYAGPTCQEPDI